MIKLIDSGTNYNVVYIGERNEYMKFSNIVCKIENAYKCSKVGWIVPKENIQPLLDKFKCEEEKQVYDYVGTEMKLEPFPYQKETVHYALHNPQSLLVLPTGSGKTCIMIALYLEALKKGLTDKPGVICVKASLKYQWVKEVEKFSNLRAKAIETPSKAKKKFDEQFEDCELFVLNYETLKNKDVCAKLREKEIEFMACDEIHYCSNHKSDRSKALFGFDDLKIKIGATATPITNNPLNAFSIFNFINKDIFKNYSSFARNYIIWRSYGVVKGVKNEDHLVNNIRPYTFIKTDEEISDQLPSVVVFQNRCNMTPNMQLISDDLLARLEATTMRIEAIEKEITDPKKLEHNDEYNKCRALVMAYQTFAQEIVNEPRLLSESDSNMAKEFLCEDVSPKIDILCDILEDIISQGEKVCIFTKYVRMQNIIMKEIEKRFDTKIAFINGSQDSKERYYQAYELFQNDEQCHVLIGTDAMAEGISLYWCRYLIEYDLADSYAIQTQRHGRVKRANSIHKVSYIYQIICNNSWDSIQERIIEKKKQYDSKLIRSLAKEE